MSTLRAVHFDDLDTDVLLLDTERYDIIYLSPFENFSQWAVCSYGLVSVYCELGVIGCFLEPELGDYTGSGSV